MIAWPLAIILFALVSIGDGGISPSHWAARCDVVWIDATGAIVIPKECAKP